jgi:hypothetical protein
MQRKRFEIANLHCCQLFYWIKTDSFAACQLGMYMYILYVYIDVQNICIHKDICRYNFFYIKL